MYRAKGSGNARKETSRLEEKRKRGREEATSLENERGDRPVNGNGLECTRRANQREEGENRRGGGREEEGKERRKRERKKESIGLCSRPSQCVLVASVCPFVPVHVRTSVRCLPWHSNRVYSRLAPVEGL